MFLEERQEREIRASHLIMFATSLPVTTGVKKIAHNGFENLSWLKLRKNWVTKIDEGGSLVGETAVPRLGHRVAYFYTEPGKLFCLLVWCQELNTDWQEIKLFIS